METHSSVCLCFWNWRQGWLLWLFSIISPSRLDGKHSWQHWEEKEMFKGRGGSQKLPLTRALSVHVLHLICTKGITGGAKSPCWWGTLSPLVSTSFAAALPLLASPPLFDFPLSSVCWKSWLCCSHWAFWGSVRRIVLCLSVWWEKLGKTMSGGRTRPLWCPFHLSSFSVLAFPDDSDDLRRPPPGVQHLTPCIVKHTIMRARTHEIVYLCLKSPDILSPSFVVSATLRHYQSRSNLRVSLERSTFSKIIWSQFLTFCLTSLMVTIKSLKV